MAIKTVTCPACGAEQAIMRDEEGKMNCVFCSEPIELPEYEEGEEFDYTYETEQEPVAPKTEPIGEKIDAVFVLNEQEVGDAFTVSGKLKERKWILYIETAIFILVGGVTGVMNIISLTEGKKVNFSEWLLVAICLFMLPFIWTMPKRTKKKIIQKSTSGNQLTVSIYENLMNIHVADADEKDDWQQEFDGSYQLIHEKGLFVIVLSNGQLLVIPERSLTEEQVDIVKTRLATKPE